jgi:hypothetical protein
MKLANLRRFDPKFIAAGKRGLERGNKDEELVWNEFAHDKARLRAVAGAIVDASREMEVGGFLVVVGDEIEEAPEGRLLTVLHTRRERNRSLVERRKSRSRELLKARGGHLILCGDPRRSFSVRKQSGRVQLAWSAPAENELNSSGEPKVCFPEAVV